MARPSVDFFILCVLGSIATASVVVTKPWFYKQPLMAAKWFFGLQEQSLLERIQNPSSLFTLQSVAWFYLYAGIVYAVWYAHGFIFKPLDLTGLYLDPLVKTDSSKGRDKDPGGMPPPFPNGWFRALDTIDLVNGQVHSEMLFNRDMVFFRDYTGVARILNLACPSCGTTLRQGKVVDNRIKCTHSKCQLEFQGEDGVCTNAPAGVAVPTAIAYPTLEKNGHIYIWHHAEREAPSYLPVIPPEVNDGSCVYHGRTEHRITAHIAEMPENGPDSAHLNVLHKDFVVGALGFMFDHLWTGEWQPGKTEEDKQNAYVHVTQRVRFLGKHVIPGSLLDVRVTQCGLGLVCLRFETPLGFIFVWETVTPVKPLLQKFHHLCWAEWRVPRLIGKGVLRGLVTQAERDIPIWNHKTYLSKPIIVKGDGPIPHFRRWFKQFFTEHSWDLAPEFRRVAQLAGSGADDNEQNVDGDAAQSKQAVLA